MSQAAPKAPPQGSPFWHFSLGLYRAPGVADACIRLQDEAGASAIAFHPRHAQQQHKGEPDYALAAETLRLQEANAALSQAVVDSTDADVRRVRTPSLGIPPPGRCLTAP